MMNTAQYHNSSRRAFWQFCLALLWLFGRPQPVGADVISVNATKTSTTTMLTTTVNGANANGLFHGTPYTAAVVNGIACFYFRGDFFLYFNDTLKGEGNIPISLTVGNNAYIEPGAVID